MPRCTPTFRGVVAQIKCEVERDPDDSADGHGGRCLRHARLLRDSQHPRHDRRRAAGEDSQAVPTQPAVERSRWDDQKDQQDWAPSMEEGGRLSSTGPRRERVLPVQVDSRRSTSKSDSRSASCRIGACVQRAQSNDRAWSTRVVRDRSVTNLRVGALGASFDLRNNATIAGRPVLGGLDAIPGAQTGGVRPSPRAGTRGCGGQPPQACRDAVPRRTRRRGDAVRGAAGPTAWAADGLAPPAPAAPDRRRVGRRPQAVPARE